MTRATGEMPIRRQWSEATGDASPATRHGDASPVYAGGRRWASPTGAPPLSRSASATEDPLSAGAAPAELTVPTLGRRRKQQSTGQALSAAGRALLGPLLGALLFEVLGGRLLGGPTALVLGSHHCLHTGRRETAATHHGAMLRPNRGGGSPRQPIAAGAHTEDREEPSGRQTGVSVTGIAV